MITKQAEPLVLRGGLISGTTHRMDVHIDRGTISRIVPAYAEPIAVPVMDISGYVLFPSFVEPHAHLDKALLVDESVPPGDLGAAIEVFTSSHYEQMSPEGVNERAYRTLRTAVARGYTAIRTHVDCGGPAGIAALAPILKIRESLRSVLDIQVVALMLPPMSGSQGTKQRALLEEVIASGVDLIGGCPTLDPHPHEAINVLLDAAAEAGIGVDFHLDENTDPASAGLIDFADALSEKAWFPSATASHCVSLGQRDRSSRRAVLRQVYEAGIGIITLPQTNLLLQGKTHSGVVPRSLPPLREILDAGVPLAAGGDNWRDAFNPLSRIDPFETVSLLVSAGHLTPEEAVVATTSGARRVLGLPEVKVRAGYPADLVAIRGGSTWEGIADASEERIVLKAGRVISDTRVSTRVDVLFG